ncbi:M24 family metallopeptidase [Fundicoccus culcitae]|uniref:Xaa-Pro peptidase family protein n=1 Tax=Fundicoccus culcitae TaxID=2969821 RepID=A0ABY5P3A8_9LACT|nr:Xaa-Pro peptidase family protein [Fundicoccus culcitae]UUX32990.1 Xaa-Pro peptidase family protein [Fundicoccus culcitae]
MYSKKIHQLQAKMREHGISNQLISDPSSINYFTGYFTQPGERMLLLVIHAEGNQHQLYLNRLFPSANLSEIQDHVIEVIVYNDGEPILNQVAASLAEGPSSIDKYWPSHFLLDLLAIDSNIQAVNQSHLVDDLRAIKSPEEQALMAQASHYNDQAMEQLIPLIAQGLSENELKNHLGEIYLALSGNSFSFPPIIAFGANGADPHHETDDSKPTLGNSVVIDIGSSYQGYCSDMTRTVFYGQPSAKALEIYAVVKQANEAAIAAIKPGVPFSHIDAIARDIITQAGYGDYFTHRLGHFIGRDVHEAGDVSAFNHQLIEEGHTFSIEPGIYLPGELGVRIEDLVIATADGCKVLNHVTKEPIILDVP